MKMKMNDEMKRLFYVALKTGYLPMGSYDTIAAFFRANWYAPVSTCCEWCSLWDSEHGVTCEAAMQCMEIKAKHKKEMEKQRDRLLSSSIGKIGDD